MFESILWIVLLVVFYLVPEILKKRRKPEEYKYPEIPDRVPPPETKAPPVKTKGQPAPVAASPEPVVLPPVFTAPVSSPGAFVAMPDTLHYLGDEFKAAAMTTNYAACQGWQGRMDQASVLHGVIFAEILQPPKALRQRRYR